MSKKDIKLTELHNNTLNKKIALRRMEIISSKDNPLITYDENNNPNLDMELFMQKCIEYDIVSRENSDILYTITFWKLTSPNRQNSIRRAYTEWVEVPAPRASTHLPLISTFRFIVSTILWAI